MVAELVVELFDKEDALPAPIIEGAVMTVEGMFVAEAEVEAEVLVRTTEDVATGVEETAELVTTLLEAAEEVVEEEAAAVVVGAAEEATDVVVGTA